MIAMMRMKVASVAVRRRVKQERKGKGKKILRRKRMRMVCQPNKGERLCPKLSSLLLQVKVQVLILGERCCKGKTLSFVWYLWSKHHICCMSQCCRWMICGGSSDGNARIVIADGNIAAIKVTLCFNCRGDLKVTAWNISCTHGMHDLCSRIARHVAPCVTLMYGIQKTKIRSLIRLM